MGARCMEAWAGTPTLRTSPVHNHENLAMHPSAPPETRDAVIQLVADQSGVKREKLTDETRIVEDLQLDGDDVVELIEQVATKFGIDMVNYRWYHHHAPEGCNPVW